MGRLSGFLILVLISLVAAAACRGPQRVAEIGGESVPHGAPARVSIDGPPQVQQPSLPLLGWAVTAAPAEVWVNDQADSLGRAQLPLQSWLEIMGPPSHGRLPVRYPGNGEDVAPGVGWVDANGLVAAGSLNAAWLPRAYPADTGPEVVRVEVPYHSQLDGTPWASANCGPTTLEMALGAFGVQVPSTVLRQQALDTQGMWGDDAGTLLDALAEVASSYGLQPTGLFQGPTLKRWTIADLTKELDAGHPVVVQVRFQALPERRTSPYTGDHYIVLTGLVGDRFLYNDAVDSDGVGYDRIMSAESLRLAMATTSDQRYRNAAFALSQ